MKVNIGDSVKNIPEKYHHGVFLMKESQLEAPKKVRLTPFERFLFAEASWRKKSLDSFILDYMEKTVPTHASVQVNRAGKKRYVVHYVGDDYDVTAIVPKSVYRKCPKELRTKQYFEW
jgi:hypothetical protein